MRFYRLKSGRIRLNESYQSPIMAWMFLNIFFFFFGNIILYQYIHVFIYYHLVFTQTRCPPSVNTVRFPIYSKTFRIHTERGPKRFIDASYVRYVFTVTEILPDYSVYYNSEYISLGHGVKSPRSH